MKNALLLQKQSVSPNLPKARPKMNGQAFLSGSLTAVSGLLCCQYSASAGCLNNSPFFIIRKIGRGCLITGIFLHLICKQIQP